MLPGSGRVYAGAMSRLAGLGAEESWSDAVKEMQAYRELVGAAMRAEKPVNFDRTDDRPKLSDAEIHHMLLRYIAAQEMQFADADAFMSDAFVQGISGNASNGEVIRAAFDDIMLAANDERRKAGLSKSGLPDEEQIEIICTGIAGLEMSASGP